MASIVEVEDAFVPTPKQAPFVNSPAKFRVYLGGLGSGKTASGAVAGRNLALVNPGCMGVVVAPTYSQARDVCLQEFLRWTPRELVKKVNESISGGLRVDLVNGHRVLFRSADKPHTLRGLSLAWSWYDEAGYGPEETHQVLVSRLRDSRAQVRAAILTSSPNGTRNWLFRKHRETVNDPTWDWHRAASYDNPHTGSDYVRDLTANVSARAAQQEIEGEFVGAEGLVYGGDFREEVHLIPYDYDPGRPVYLAVDFGFRKSAVLAFQQRREDGAWVCFDEEMLENVGTRDMAQVILQKPYKAKIAGAVHDPAGLNNAQDTGAPLVQVLQDEAGLACESPEERRITRGIETVRFNLAPFKGTPKLYFAASLRKLEQDRGWTRGIVQDLGSYHYPENTDSEIPEHDDSSHSMDALRYFALVKCPVGGVGGFGSIARH